MAILSITKLFAGEALFMRRQLRFQPELFSRIHSWTGTALFVSAVFVIFATHACADELLHRYECNKHPSDPSTGWMASEPNTCESPCTSSVQNGHFRFFWPTPGGRGRYYHQLAPSADEVPQKLWIEWSFRSNHPLLIHVFLIERTALGRCTHV